MTLPNTDINLNTVKRKGIALGMLALMFLMGLAVGKFTSAPNITLDKKTSVVTAVTTQTQTQTATQTQTQVQQAATVNKDLVKDSDTVTTTVVDKKPSGETVTTTTTETKSHVDNSTKAKDTSKSSTQANTNQQVVANTQSLTTAKTSLKETITQSQPNWRLAAFAGINTGGLGLSGSALTTGPLSYGGEVDRRIIGPFWLGAMVEKAGPGLEVNGVISFQF